MDWRNKMEYESKSKILENRLAELSEELDKTESMLNLKKKRTQRKNIKFRD